MTDADHLQDLHLDSLAVAAGRPARAPGSGVNPAIELSTTFLPGQGSAYARAGTPAWAALEEAVGALEGGAALVHASGMGAISAAFSLVPRGGVVVACDQTYSGTAQLLAALEADGVQVRRRHATDTEGLLDALEGADLVWLESPTNPLLDVVDDEPVLARARDLGVTSVVDNTLTTPALARPLERGADVVVHSVTKYLSGHSDVLLGATVTGENDRGGALAERLRSHRTLHGAAPGPVEAYLALRGLRTFALRFERACASAAELSRRLADHPAVSRVRYPGRGAVLAVELGGDARRAEALCEATRLWVHSTSLGGVESQLERRRRHPAELEAVPEDLVRLSVGIEHVDDLWSDLDRALRAAGA